MRIAFYCTNEFSCPLPKEIVYAPMGLAEKIVKGLEKRGHDVTFYTPTDSEIKIKKVDCGMISYYRLKNKAMSGGFHDQLQLTIYEQLMASKMYEDARKNKYDLIHAFHLTPKILPFVNLAKTPTVFTLHDPMSASWNKFIKYCPWKNKAHYVSISDNQRKGMPDLNYAGTVYNGMEIEKFEFKKKPENYLAFLGRYSSEKGADAAVSVAIKSKEKLPLVTEALPLNILLSMEVNSITFPKLSLSKVLLSNGLSNASVKPDKLESKSETKNKLMMKTKISILVLMFAIIYLFINSLFIYLLCNIP